MKWGRVCVWGGCLTELGCVGWQGKLRGSGEQGAGLEGVAYIPCLYTAFPGKTLLLLINLGCLQLSLREADLLIPPTISLFLPCRL